MSQEGPWFLAAIWNLIYDFRAQKIVSYYTQIQPWSLTYTLQIAVFERSCLFQRTICGIQSDSIFRVFWDSNLEYTKSIASNLQAPFYILQISQNLSPKWCLMIFAITKQVPMFFSDMKCLHPFFVKNGCLHPFLLVHIHGRYFLVSMPLFFLKQRGPKQHPNPQPFRLNPHVCMIYILCTTY